MADGTLQADTQRLDRWLWAARFFKTRSAAAQAVAGGKVQVNGVRARPAKRILPDTVLEIRRGGVSWCVVVRRLAAQRRPAPEAALLYQETPESVAVRRQRAAERRQLEPRRPIAGAGRPTKRERRRLGRLTGR